MTNEERRKAAEWFRNRAKNFQMPGARRMYEIATEALEMAIRALEGDGDMISRQAVMKEFSDFVRKSNNSDFAQTPTWNDAVSLVGSMPSAQPEWIPCSERLPEVSKDPYFIDEIDGAMLFESERVLVFGKNEDGYDYAVATNIYSTAMGNEWSGAYDAAENELTQILAWMPLQKPYGGESE